MNAPLDRFGRQLEAITDALHAAQTETDTDERHRLLAVIDRAFDAARDEYKTTQHPRPKLRLIKGGLAGGALAAIATRARHHTAALTTAGTAIGAAAVGATMLLGNTQMPPATAAPPAIVTVQPSPHGPQPSPTGTPRAIQPAPPAGPAASTPASEQAESAPHPTVTGGASPSPGIIPTLLPIGTQLPSPPGIPSIPPTVPALPPPVVQPTKGPRCLQLDLLPVLDIGACVARHG